VGPALLVLATLACKPATLRPLTQGLGFEPPVPKPTLVLTSTAGTLYDFRRETEGRAVLLYFGYTRCPDVCPVTLLNVAQAFARLSPETRRAVTVVFVTTDPRRDTPPVLRAWLDHFDPGFVGLTGDSATIAGAMRALRLGEAIIDRSQGDTNYSVGHAAIVLGFSRDNLAHVGFPFGLRQRDWVNNIQALVDQ
jgi:protein SCO1/2